MTKKFKVTFCEADTGIVLKENGERWLNYSEKQNNYLKFDKIEEAFSRKDKLLKEFPFGEVSIVNGDDVTVYRNDELLDIYLKERSEVYRWLSLPFFVKWFKKKPECKIYKGR